jgi:hypothetical protein
MREIVKRDGKMLWEKRGRWVMGGQGGKKGTGGWVSLGSGWRRSGKTDTLPTPPPAPPFNLYFQHLSILVHNHSNNLLFILSLPHHLLQPQFNPLQDDGESI